MMNKEEFCKYMWVHYPMIINKIGHGMVMKANTYFMKHAKNRVFILLEYIRK